MKTYTEFGDVQVFTAPTGGVVTSLPYLVGSLMVIATETVAQTLPFEGLVCGVVAVPKNHHEAWTEGLKIYWDVADNNFTLDPDTATNPLMGVAVGPIVPAVISLATDALAADLLISGYTLQVLDYAQLATDDAVVTVTINGTAYVLTEGTEWTAASSDDATATSLAAAIALLTGVTAAAVTDTVTVVPATGFSADYPTLGSLRLDGATR